MIDNEELWPQLDPSEQNLPPALLGFFDFSSQIPVVLANIITRDNQSIQEVIDFTITHSDEEYSVHFCGVIYDHGTDALYFVEQVGSNPDSLTLFNVYDFILFHYCDSDVPEPLEIRRDIPDFCGWTNRFFPPSNCGKKINIAHGTSACRVLDNISHCERHEMYELSGGRNALRR